MIRPALLALALGSVAPGDIPTVWNIVWNATATFIAVIVTVIGALRKRPVSRA